MSYFKVLAVYLLPPLVLLSIYVHREVWSWGGARLDAKIPGFRREKRSPSSSTVAKPDWKPYLAILVHVLLALIYTSPWDNYLVASGVWWYNPELVTGITLGWVPIEEYTFFILQTLLTGLWGLYLLRGSTVQSPVYKARSGVRFWASLLVLLFWIGSVFMLILDWMPGRYLALILSWALLPILLQVVFGADLLLAEWKRVIMVVMVPTLYLWWVDALAIASGTWTIDPAQTTGVKWGVLPLEEFLFFFMTNLMIAFGLTLMLSPYSSGRIRYCGQVISDRLQKRLSGGIQKTYPGAELGNWEQRIGNDQDKHKLSNLGKTR
jgi:lycopene cyclase domain-containing protein